jgi:hypothetical protein
MNISKKTYRSGSVAYIVQQQVNGRSEYVCACKTREEAEDVVAGRAEPKRVRPPRTTPIYPIESEVFHPRADELLRRAWV